MTETPVDVLVRRIDRLEGENRRSTRRITTAIALVLAAVFLMGQTAPRGPTVEAQKVVLKDRRGNIRAVLGEFSEDEPFGLLIFDANQRIRTKLGLQGDGSPALVLTDDRGVDRAMLHPASGLRLLGDGPSVTLGVNHGNEPTLHLNDKDGWTRAALVLTSTNTAPILKFLDPRGNARAWIGAMSDGKAQLLFMNRPQPAQSGRAGDPSRPNVAATATLEVDADGTMGLRFARGGTIWKAP
jgi:hypothetical protein